MIMFHPNKKLLRYNRLECRAHTAMCRAVTLHISCSNASISAQTKYLKSEKDCIPKSKYYFVCAEILINQVQTTYQS